VAPTLLSLSSAAYRATKNELAAALLAFLLFLLLMRRSRSLRRRQVVVAVLEEGHDDADRGGEMVPRQ